MIKISERTLADESLSFVSLDDSTEQDRPLGKILKNLLGLTDEQLTEIAQHQTAKEVRFGEAAIALGYATNDDVLWALSQQFHYHYSPAKINSISPELIVATDPFSDESERFREFRSQLMLGLDSKLGQKITSVLSLDSGDGKSYFAANIAISFSQLGARTLLIDANMRRPRQHDIFGIQSDFGLSSSLLNGRLQSEHVLGIPFLPNLFLLPVGKIPPNPLELLQKPALISLLSVTAKRFDYIVIDTPAVSMGADAKVIAAASRNSVLLTRLGVTKSGELKNFVESVRHIGNSTPLSIILNTGLPRKTN